MHVLSWKLPISMMMLNHITMWLIFSTLVSFMIWLVSKMFSMFDLSINSSETFECGVEAFQESRVPLFLHFYMVGILFLIFDIELIISLPMVNSCMKLDEWMLFWTIFIIILIMGLIFEIFMGSLDWKE